MIGKVGLGGGADYRDSLGGAARQSLATGNSVTISIGNCFGNCFGPEACGNKTRHSGTDCISRYCKIHGGGTTPAKAQLRKVPDLVSDVGTRWSQTGNVEIHPRGIELQRVIRDTDHFPIVPGGSAPHTAASRERADITSTPAGPRWQRGGASGAYNHLTSPELVPLTYTFTKPNESGQNRVKISTTTTGD